jgi:hypothetical protein
MDCGNFDIGKYSTLRLLPPNAFASNENDKREFSNVDSGNAFPGKTNREQVEMRNFAKFARRFPFEARIANCSKRCLACRPCDEAEAFETLVRLFVHTYHSVERAGNHPECKRPCRRPCCLISPNIVAEQRWPSKRLAANMPSCTKLLSGVEGIYTSQSSREQQSESINMKLTMSDK